jgi:beta-glucanase (GH16 family)
MKNIINFTWLRVRAIFNYFFRISKKLSPPDDYTLVFNETFEKMLDTDVWRIGQPWGTYHPAHLNQHYDVKGNCVYVTSNKTLALETRRIPKIILKSELPIEYQKPTLPDEITIPYSVGLVMTKTAFSYGWFEAEIKLPKGKGLWPAFWLSCKHSWPPEIDILEAYSRKDKYYSKNFLWKKLKFWNLQPNLHFGVVENNTKEDYGPYNSPVFDVTERFVKYTCHWTEKFIKIFYDGNLIFECKDEKILRWFNVEKNHMELIINNGTILNPKFKPDESIMEVKNVKIYQKTSSQSVIPPK